MIINESYKDDATWAADRLHDTYSRHCLNMGEELAITYEKFRENLRRSIK